MSTRQIYERPSPVASMTMLLANLFMACTCSGQGREFPISEVSGVLPSVHQVETQPLLLLTQRLTEALTLIGSPLSPETQTELAALNVDQDEATVTANVQRLLDPRCVAAVEIARDGSMKVSPGQPVTVEQNGWRAMLVKVINDAGVQTQLRVDSPSARPLPHGPLDDVANRWMQLSAFEAARSTLN